MQIIINPKEYAEQISDEGIVGMPKSKLEKIMRELKEIGNDATIKEANVGVGADWIVILAIINSIANVFLVGDKIIKGIEGWVKIAKKLKSLIKKGDVAFIDEDSASLLSIELISAKEKISTLEKINAAEIPLIDLSTAFLDRSPDDFISKPQSYFLQVYKVNDKKIYVIGIKSDGRIKNIETFDLSEMNRLGYEEEENKK